MPPAPDLESRVAVLEVRVEEVAADAKAARHLAAARDHDLADLAVKVDANRKAVNALGVQTAARFDRLDERVDRLDEKVDAGFAEMRGKFDQVDAGFVEMRGKFDQVAAGFEHIGGLITTHIERDEQ